MTTFWKKWDSRKGPFKYYVIKKVGGWVRPNAYVFLQGGWVGVAKCLRNNIIRITENWSGRKAAQDWKIWVVDGYKFDHWLQISHAFYYSSQFS